MGRQTEFIFLALVICALMLSSSFQPRGSPNRPVTVTPSAQLHPPEPVQPPLESTGRQPRSGVSDDAASSRSIAAGGHQKRLRVRLIMLVVNIFPVRRCAENSRPPAPANSPRSTPRQRQSKLRAASSLGQPRPTGTCVLAEPALAGGPSLRRGTASSTDTYCHLYLLWLYCGYRCGGPSLSRVTASTTRRSSCSSSTPTSAGPSRDQAPSTSS